MKLKTKFVSGFLTTASLVAILGFINVQTKRDVNDKFNKITEKTAPELIALDRVKVASLRMMMEANSYALIQAESKEIQKANSPNIKINKDQEEETEEYEEASEELEEGLSAIKALADTSAKQDINLVSSLLL
jgi:hypothetical protein